MYESGYGCIINAAHVLFLEKMDSKQKLGYLKELWQKDPKKYLEWKSECILLDDLDDCFGSITDIYHEQFITDERGIKIINYLKKNGESFNVISKDLASHMFEQIFDDNDHLISQEIKEIF